jgi:hypothetical protein
MFIVQATPAKSAVENYNLIAKITTNKITFLGRMCIAKPTISSEKRFIEIHRIMFVHAI